MKKYEPRPKNENDDIFGFAAEKNEDAETQDSTEQNQREQNQTFQLLDDEHKQKPTPKPWMSIGIALTGFVALSIIIAVSIFGGGRDKLMEQPTLLPSDLPALLEPQPWYSNGIEFSSNSQTTIVCGNQDVLCMTLQTSDPEKSLTDLSSMVLQEKDDDQLYEIEIHVRKAQM